MNVVIYIIAFFFLKQIDKCQASHFSYGTVSWRRAVLGRNVGSEINFKAEFTYRRNYFSHVPNIGDTLVDGQLGSFHFNSASHWGIIIPISGVYVHSVRPVNEQNWFTGLWQEQLAGATALPNKGPWDVSWGSCCRIGALLEDNNDNDYQMLARITFVDGKTGSITATGSNREYFGLNVLNVFKIPITLPEGIKAKFEFSPQGSAGAELTTPIPGSHGENGQTAMTLDQADGTLRWTPKKIGIYAVQVRILEECYPGPGYDQPAGCDDDNPDSIPIDWLIETLEGCVNSNTPCAPSFPDALPDETFLVGIEHSFTVRCEDMNLNDYPQLETSMKPNGASCIRIDQGDILDNGEPGSFTKYECSWTPTEADIGDLEINICYKAFDQNGRVSFGNHCHKWIVELEKDPLRYGVVNCDHSWRTVTFIQQFISQPVVIVGPASFGDTDHLSPIISNITTYGFRICLAKAANHVGSQAFERVSYVAAIPGTYHRGGSTLKFATHSLPNRPQTFTSVNYLTPPFPESSKISVMSTIQNVPDVNLVRTRQQDVDYFHFEVLWEPEDSRRGPSWTGPPPSDVGYMAISCGYSWIEGNWFEAGITSSIDENIEGITFANTHNDDIIFIAQIQTYNGYDSAGLRVNSATNNGVTLHISEDTTTDAEVDHLEEDISWFTIGQTAHAEFLRYGNVVINHNWHLVTFTTAFNTIPVVICGPSTFNGGHHVAVHVKDVTNVGFSVRLVESTDHDVAHTTETVGYVAATPGTYTVESGRTLKFGSYFLNNASPQDFYQINYEGGSLKTGPPVSVMSTIQDGDVSYPLRTRQKDCNNDGFMCCWEPEEKALNSLGPMSWNVGYMAVHSSISMIQGNWFEAGVASDIDSNIKQIPWSNYHSREKVYIAQITSFNNPDSVGLRLNSITNNGVTVHLDEEESLDSEVAHVGEDVSWFCLAIDPDPITSSPIPFPTRAPTPSPTPSPTPPPTQSPTPSPTKSPTTSPTNSPTWPPHIFVPSFTPEQQWFLKYTNAPTQGPVSFPTPATLPAVVPYVPAKEGRKVLPFCVGFGEGCLPVYADFV